MKEIDFGHNVNKIKAKVGRAADIVFQPFLNYMDGEGEPPAIANYIAFAAVLPASADIAFNTQLAAEVANGANPKYEVPAQQHNAINHMIFNTRTSTIVGSERIQTDNPPGQYYNEGTIPHCDTTPGIPNPFKKSCFREVGNKIIVEPGTKTNRRGEKEFNTEYFCQEVVLNPNSETCHQAVQDALTGNGYEFEKTESGKVKLGNAAVDKTSLLKGVNAGFTTKEESNRKQNKEFVKNVNTNNLKATFQEIFIAAGCGIGLLAISGLAVLNMSKRDKARKRQEKFDKNYLNKMENSPPANAHWDDEKGRPLHRVKRRD